MCSTDLPGHKEHPVHNHERVMRNTKRALSALDFSLKRTHGSERPRAAVKGEQRSLRRARAGALQQMQARKYARKRRQYRAAGKWHHAHYTGTDNNSKDDSDDDTMPASPDTEVETARACAPYYRKCATYCWSCQDYCYGIPVHVAEFCGACIRARRGWRVIAIYLLDHDYSACYYLAVNAARSRAILSAIRLPGNYSKYRAGWDDAGYPIYHRRHMDLQSHILERLHAALRSGFLPKRRICDTWLLRLRCTNLARFARSKLDQARPEQIMHQRATYNEAFSALYTTFLWSWPQFLTGGRSASWQIRVWTPERYHAIVRLQAGVRGWLLRRELYSPYTELGQRRLHCQWASFQHGL